MEEIVSTRLLEYNNSTFLIDMVEHSFGEKHVRIIQTIQQKNQKQLRHEINISSELLPDFIYALVSYSKDVCPDKPVTVKMKPKDLVSMVSEVEKNEIQKRYLKGISIQDLCLQFEMKKSFIIQILQSRGVEIVEPLTTGKWKKNF
jgi:hypothetical protein